MSAPLEFFTAFATFEWPLSGVNANMPRQISSPREYLPTISAFEGSLASMDPNMLRVMALFVR